ncbi:MmcQ/YjbR family DNA-binding protein [Budviciaceae bacterium BWR-B9]|uniref:MmcQ/YjbR family DNA-binding protein n=1 Tax=Limnobaculum allomyrinae TaxID=2791986 RepID=A0ABS1IUA8_9GAMM|nr:MULTISPECIES: MmcQ/YjbR family DNA-binding protein [Limnobaculum]MBK5145126.1 MmcQ/YjbR family DNA-binding protein [Limnobaculum allomyrinae]MBV7692957.1 MmcQ/YjbR family DNA-binding protein [Limnobaculum sp. M2-1]
MNLQDCIEYCLTKTGSVHDYQPLWDADRVKVGGKIFAIVGDLNGRSSITLKCPPALAERLRDEHQNIIPGYHMNKALWNTLFLNGKLEDALIRNMIDISYQEVRALLPAYVKKALAAGESLEAIK